MGVKDLPDLISCCNGLCVPRSSKPAFSMFGGLADLRFILLGTLSDYVYS